MAQYSLDIRSLYAYTSLNKSKLKLKRWKMANSPAQFCGNCGKPREAGKSACPNCGSSYGEFPTGTLGSVQGPTPSNATATVHSSSQPNWENTEQAPYPGVRPPVQPTPVPVPPGGYASSGQYPPSVAPTPPGGYPSSGQYPPPVVPTPPGASTPAGGYSPPVVPAPTSSGKPSSVGKFVLAEGVAILVLFVLVGLLFVRDFTKTSGSPPIASNSTPTAVATTRGTNPTATTGAAATTPPGATATTPPASTTPPAGAATATPGVLTENVLLKCTSTNCNDPVIVTITTITIDTSLGRMVWAITAQNKLGTGICVGFNDFTLTEPIGGQKYTGSLVLPGSNCMNPGQTIDASATFAFVPYSGRKYILTCTIGFNNGDPQVVFDPTTFTF